MCGKKKEKARSTSRICAPTIAQNKVVGDSRYLDSIQIITSYFDIGFAQMNRDWKDYEKLYKVAFGALQLCLRSSCGGSPPHVEIRWKRCVMS
ncbi:hypothetical protein TIFTF001_021907 [Ficus carica]|uniref:Uncharacterized protein n=1 Tax=Ficus carica TaxID=3494 RepID=A0AA88DJW3_FICCA|nr:hypothetical protein TIFTF001_021907 [Ficus carica]